MQTQARSELPASTAGERLVREGRRVGRLERRRVGLAHGGRGRIDALRARAHALHERLEHAPRWLRLSLGVIFLLGGVAGILPVLGFWMVPLGIAILAMDVPPIRRAWCAFLGWWHRRQGKGPPTSGVCGRDPHDAPRGFIDPAPPLRGPAPLRRG